MSYQIRNRSKSPWLLAGQLLCALMVPALWVVGASGAQDGQVQEVAQDENARPAGTEAAAAGSGSMVLVGKVDGEINLVASAYVRRLVLAAADRGAKAMVLELNTFGGQVDAAVAIRDALIDSKVTTVVFINKRAISAGALMALACDKIVMTSGGTIGAATPIYSGPGQELPEAVEEKYVSYFRQEMRSTAETKGRNGDIAEAMVDKDYEIPGLIAKGKLLTLTTHEALARGIADAEAESLDQALDKLGIQGQVETFQSSWSEELVGFLTSSAVSGVLFLLMMVLAYLEYQTPGFGIFGSGAIACFLVLFFSHYLVNLAGWEDLILFGIGVALLAVEIFVLPGFGVAGILGILCIMAAAVMTMLAGGWGDLSFDNPLTLNVVERVLVATVLSFAVLLLLVRLLPRNGTAGGLGSGLFLGTTLARESGYTSHEGDAPVAQDTLIGQEGEAITPLRPAGRALLGGQRLEVQTEGEFLAAGDRLRVLRREGGHIIVRRA